jgi:hypothetical protein
MWPHWCAKFDVREARRGNSEAVKLCGVKVSECQIKWIVYLAHMFRGSYTNRDRGECSETWAMESGNGINDVT